MKARKIDDEALLEMYHAGKLQKDIADHFGVTPVAISKRLKRLLPQPETVLDKCGFTDKVKMFCVQKAQGLSNTGAVIASFDVGSVESAKVIGSQLMSNPEIQQTVKELMDSHGLTRSYRIGKLRSHIDSRDPSISLKALDQSWRLDGSYAPEKHDHRTTGLMFTKIDLDNY